MWFCLLGFDAQGIDFTLDRMIRDRAAWPGGPARWPVQLPALLQAIPPANLFGDLANDFR
jgi:hypothetical protein